MSTTGPVIWMTRPVAGVVAVAMGDSPPGSASARLSAGRDLDHLAGDVGLANLVVRQRVVLDELVGIVGRVAHRDHPARFLAGLALEHRLEQPGRDVAWHELLEEPRGVGLQDELVARNPGLLVRDDREELDEG